LCVAGRFNIDQGHPDHRERFVVCRGFDHAGFVVQGISEMNRLFAETHQPHTLVCFLSQSVFAGKINTMRFSDRKHRSPASGDRFAGFSISPFFGKLA
jgi:hypothetical protein